MATFLRDQLKLDKSNGDLFFNDRYLPLFCDQEFKFTSSQGGLY